MRESRKKGKFGGFTCLRERGDPRRRSRTGRDLLFLLNPSLRHAAARVTPSWPITRAADLLAEQDGELAVTAGGIDLAFGPGSVRVVAVD